jgi:DNA-binding SARP family transcriptional activator
MYHALVKTLLALSHNDEKTAKKHAGLMIRATKKKGYHGILLTELKHRPELMAFARKIPAFRSYLDERRVTHERSKVWVTFFGGLRVDDGDHQSINLEWPTGKTKSLFAFLVFNRSVNLTRMQVLDALWSGLNKKKAHENLRTTAYRVRQTLKSANMQGVKQEAIFTHQRGRYILFPDLEIESDVDDFNRHLKLADIARSPEEKKRALSRALDISRASFLPDIYDQWIDTQRSVFREQRLAALREIIAIASGQKDDLACIDHCRRYLAIEPMSEEIACICMGSLKNLGRLSEIKKVYQTLEKTLREEIQSAPASETHLFYRSLIT